MEISLVSVVIPVMNERDNVRPLLEELQAALANLPVEFIVVDDGSTDGTLRELQTLAVEEPRLRVLQLRRNFGQSAAMLAGIENARGDVIVTLDGDRQNDPADIPAMVQHLRFGYDLVHGWRKERRDGWWLRRVPSMVANWLIRRVTDCPVHDLGCALKAMRREIADEIELHGDMHRFIAVLARERGARCLEVVVNHRPRTAGKAKYGLGRTMRVVLDLMTVKFLEQFSTRPMRLFGRLGLASLLTSAALIAASLAASLVGIRSLWLSPAALLPSAAALFMGGIQLLVFGLLSEQISRIAYRRGIRRPYALVGIINEPQDVPAQRNLRRNRAM
ncbi:MAG: glycosyltransferase family 2 protein [Planctomycetota bacterium]|nr:glycosyltransferase family 2 protein [Planctomycetota bacterium]MDA1178905.1 glycosyltransferase family 2 protein [Planctomycetota bacterium]